MRKHFSSYERFVAFLKQIIDLSKKYKTIFIIHGAGHFVQQGLV